jgi:hypothetical protein
VFTLAHGGQQVPACGLDGDGVVGQRDVVGDHTVVGENVFLGAAVEDTIWWVGVSLFDGGGSVEYNRYSCFSGHGDIVR